MAPTSNDTKSTNNPPYSLMVYVALPELSDGRAHTANIFVMRCCPSIWRWGGLFKRNYIPTIFLTVFAVLIVSFLLIRALAVFDHQFVF